MTIEIVVVAFLTACTPGVVTTKMTSGLSCSFASVGRRPEPVTEAAVSADG